MDSHLSLNASRSIVVTSLALVLAACGSDVDVGEFEDGAGGTSGSTTTATGRGGDDTPAVVGSSTSTTTTTTTGSESSTGSGGEGGEGGGDGSTTIATSSTGTGGAGGATTCGGKSPDNCAEDELCDYPDGGCGFDDGVGTCQPRPQGCPFDLIVPVCACDGEVYQNECFAQLAGTDPSDLEGLCPPETPCGGKTGQFCAPDQFCDFAGDSCGWNDESGVCRPRPTACSFDELTAPCACDGEFYPNPCEAAMNGTDIWGGEDGCNDGGPEFCGGIAGLECDADEFCDYPQDSCGGDDSLGVCRTRPTECPEPEDGEGVCICDFGAGDSYDSVCLANQAGHDSAGGPPLECGGA